MDLRADFDVLGRQLVLQLDDAAGVEPLLHRTWWGRRGEAPRDDDEAGPPGRLVARSESLASVVFHPRVV
jgi:hypothetical protein